MNLGGWELGIILVIVLLLFGGAKLPQLARSLGEAQREFRKGHDDGKTDDDTADTDRAGTNGTRTDEPPPPAT